MSSRSTRRDFIKGTTAAAAAAMTSPYWLSTKRSLADESKDKNDRLAFGLIGAGGQGTYDAKRAQPFADIVAIADVDSEHVAKANETLSQGKAEGFGDYHKLLDRKDIDAVIIGTPDHWHTKIALDAMRAGKDVYCEKPLTLTIDEGKLLRDAVKKTGRVFQVGTQQRSEPPHLFVTAIALVRDGRIGKIKKIQCAIGESSGGGPFAKMEPPKNLDWDFWLGPAPKVDYIPQRVHGNFRWWFDYSGGQMTDWGAHHVDIAHWALGANDTGPIHFEGTASFPTPMKGGYPTTDDCYQTATAFNVTCKFENGVELVIRHDTINGVLIEGDKGRIFVNRGRLTGKPADELKENPLPEDALTKVYKGKQPGYHMQNFVECIRDRSEPISDVASHHRAVTTCHLANIAIRLGRPIKWDPVAERIVGDDEAAKWQNRESRKGYEVA